MGLRARRPARPASSPPFRGVLSRLPRAAARLALTALLLAGAVGVAAPASAVQLVSNFKQGSDTNAGSSLDRAQLFTTGSNTGGYTLTSVKVGSDDSNGDDFSVGVCTVDANDLPTSTCTSLTAPSSFSAGALRFAAPAGTSLSRNTTYAVVIKIVGSGSVSLDVTGSNNEDSGAATGWSIANNLLWRSGGAWNTQNNSVRIAVIGSAKSASNTAPTASNGEVTAGVNAEYAFSASDFNFSDTDSGDELESVKIVTVESAGDLEFNGADVTAGLVVDVSEIDGGDLTFEPAANAQGSPYATFTFKVNDGDDDSASEYTMTINVVPLPAITQVEVTSTPTSGTTPKKYGAGEKIQVTVTFDEAVTVTGDPVFQIRMGNSGGTILTKEAAYVRGSGTMALVFEYTVQSADRDDNGIWIEADALKLDGDDLIQDSDNNNAIVTHTAPRGQSDHKVDGSLTPPNITNTAPTASDGEVTVPENVRSTFAASDFNFMDTDANDVLESVKIVSRPGKGLLLLDNSPIVGNDLPKTVTRAELDAGKLEYLPPTDESGDDFATFNFKVNDGDDDSASAYTMTIDVVQVPEITQVAVTSTPRSGTTPKKYGAGEKIQVTVTFDEAVTVTGDPVFLIELGVLVSQVSKEAAYISGSGSMALVFEYTVQSADRDTDGITIETDAVRLDADDAIRDGDSNNAILTHDAPGEQTDHKVDGSLTPPADTTAPTVSAAAVTAAKPKELVITFSEALATGSVPAASAFAVKIGGSAGPGVSSVAIDSGDATKVRLGLAVALDASQTSVTVDYTKPGSNPLKDAANNEVATFAGQAVTNNAPACPTGQPSDAFWTACLTIGKGNFPTTFYGFVFKRGGALSDEEVTYKGVNVDVSVLRRFNANFELSFGGTIPGPGRLVLQVGATALSFDAGGSSRSWAVPPALAWTDANIGDKVSVSLRPAPPTVSQVAVTSTPTSGTTPKKYGAGEKIQITVTFRQAVTVTGDPEFEFKLGNSGQAVAKRAAYVRGSGSTVLVFEYTVQSADRDDDGIWIDADAVKLDADDLIRDGDGNKNAILSHLARKGQSDHKVDGSLTPPADTTAPTVSAAAVTAAKPKELVITFNELLATGSVPAASAFAVKVGGNAGPGVSSVAIDSSDATRVNLGLAVALDAGQKNVTVDYTNPGTANSPLKDADDNEVATFTGRAVVNNAPACPTGQPADAFWTACVTVGKNSLGTSFGAFRSLYGALSDKTFTRNGTSYEIDELIITQQNALSLSFTADPRTASDEWVLQVGSHTFNLGEHDLYSISKHSYRKYEPGLSWTDANIGDKVSVSLRPAPVTRRIGGRVVRAGQPFLYTLRDGTFTDPAGAGLTYSAALVNGSPLPDWLTFDARRRILRGTPTNAEATGPDERHLVAFTATDGDGGEQVGVLRIGVWPDEDPPTIRSVSKASGKLVLTYNEPLDEDSEPGGGAFAVTDGGNPVTVDSVEVTGRAVVLTLASAFTGAAQVSYTVPTGANAAPVRDVAGTNAAAFSNMDAPDYVVSLRALQTQVSEGAESAGFEISLKPVPTDPKAVFFVHWKTVPGTAVPGWTSQTGADYTGTGGTYALGNNTTNEPTHRVWVRVNDDGFDESNETFSLRIALGLSSEQTGIVNPTSAPQYVKDMVVRIDTAEAEVTITDNDSGPSVTLRAPGGRIGDDLFEGDERASFGVWLLSPTRVNSTVTVNYAVRAATAAEAGGRARATADTDFTATTGTVTFNAGETYKTVSLDIPRTPEREADEVFAVALSSPSAGARIDESLGIYTISDNPGPRKSRIGVRSGAPPESDGGGCGVNLSVEFRDGNGERTEVEALAAADFAVGNGRVGTPVADADGLGWTVPAWSTQGFTGLMRVRLAAKAPDPEARAPGWDAAEQVLRVAGDTDCAAVARNELASLALEGLELDPAFEAGTTAYTAAAPEDSETVTVTAAAIYGASEVAITPADADEEAEGHQVALAEGETGIAVAVTPADGSAAKTWTVAVTRGPAAADAGVLTGFVLVDASTDADLGAVESGGTVTVSAGGSYGIRAGVEADAEVGSVVLTLAGPGADDAHTQTENIAPWSLYGDDMQGAEHGRALAAGSYTLTATAYAERAGAGAALGTLTVPFTVEVEAPPPGVLTGFTLLDASDQSTVAALTNGADIDLGGRSGGSFAIRADVVSGATVGSVALSLSGEKTVSATENIAPYSLYGDRDDGNGGRALDGASLPAGTYTLSATAYAERRGAGDVLGTLTVSFEVLAPAALTVADAQAEEGTDATLDFAVTLDREATGTVTVEYATSDGTATAGSDYSATSGTLTFQPGETEKTVSVPVLEDDHDEGSETLTLRLTNAQGATISDGEATGTITNSDAIPEAWLARFGRTVTGQVLDAVEARLTAPRQAGAQMALAGQALPSWRPGSGAGADPGSGSGAGLGSAAGAGPGAEVRPGHDQWTGATPVSETGVNPGSGAGVNDNAASEERLSLADSQGRSAMETIRGWMADATAGRSDAVGRSSGTLGASGGAGPSGFRSRPLTPRDFLTGSSFALTAKAGEGRGAGHVSLWGRGAISGFDGREGALSLDGEVTTGLIGADWASDPGSGSGRWIAGLAIGHSTGTGGYRRGGDCEANCGGRIEASLTGLYPYAGIDLTERLSVWAAAGYGAGEVTVTPEGGPGLTADLSMAMGAAGVRSAVLRPEGGDGLSLDFKGDARFTRTSSDAVRSDGGNLEAADADVWLLRAGVEGSRRFALGNGTDGGSSLTPSFEIALRLDGGDAETGFGADLGGGLAFADPENGLRLDLKGRVLLAHRSAGFREWGASGALAWDPRPETDRGLALTLRQSWGASPAGGMDALLSRETLAGLAANDNGTGSGAGFRASSRLEAEIGYGLPMFDGAFTGTPNIGFGLSGGGGRDWRIGWRLTSAIKGDPGFEISLDATRHEPANDDGPEHAVMLRATVRW